VIYLIEAVVGLKNWNELARKNTVNEEQQGIRFLLCYDLIDEFFKIIGINKEGKITLFIEL
jgi:hypothetical protein